MEEYEDMESDALDALNATATATATEESNENEALHQSMDIAHGHCAPIRS